MQNIYTYTRKKDGGWLDEQFTFHQDYYPDMVLVMSKNFGNDWMLDWKVNHVGEIVSIWRLSDLSN